MIMHVSVQVYSEVPLGSETSGGAESGRPELQMQALGLLQPRKASNSVPAERFKFICSPKLKQRLYRFTIFYII